MTALRQEEICLSPEEYLEAEELSEIRHEYLNGLVYGMAGGSPAHAVIQANILAGLHAQLRGKPCRPFGSDMKVRIFRGVDRRFYYPDVSVVCHPQMVNHWQDDAAVIVEVLSPSTERVDHAEKRVAYSGLPGLREYVLADSRLLAVTVHRRPDPSSEWQIELLRLPEQTLALPSVGCTLPLREIYADSGLL